MLLRNLSSELGLVNGSQGHIYDFSWAPNADPERDPPEVIMVAFDNYEGRGFIGGTGQELLDSRARKVVPILRTRQEFQLGKITCTREQFPLTVAYAITVHKAQGQTLSRVVIDVSEKEFASGLNYVACSRVTSLQGLLIERSFPRSCVNKKAGEGM